MTRGNRAVAAILIAFVAMPLTGAATGNGYASLIVAACAGWATWLLTARRQ